MGSRLRRVACCETQDPDGRGALESSAVSISAVGPKRLAAADGKFPLMLAARPGFACDLYASSGSGTSEASAVMGSHG